MAGTKYHIAEVRQDGNGVWRVCNKEDGGSIRQKPGEKLEWQAHGQYDLRFSFPPYLFLSGGNCWHKAEQKTLSPGNNPLRRTLCYSAELAKDPQGNTKAYHEYKIEIRVGSEWVSVQGASAVMVESGEGAGDEERATPPRIIIDDPRILEEPSRS